MGGNPGKEGTLRFSSVLRKAVVAILVAIVSLTVASGVAQAKSGVGLSETGRHDRAIGMRLAQETDMPYSEFECLDRLWIRESGWNHRARNRSSGAYGIPQSLPATKMNTEGTDWRSNPETQIWWGFRYIHDRYKMPCKAWEHSQSTGWY